MTLDQLGFTGQCLLWLGVCLVVVSLACGMAFYAITLPGVPHDTAYIVVQSRDRLIFLMPLVAGLLLIASGWGIGKAVSRYSSAVDEFLESHSGSGQ